MRRWRSLGVGSALALIVVLIIGIQLGRIPFRYRRQIWQVQGAALGGLVGFGLGQLSARMGRRFPYSDSEELSTKPWP